MSAPPYLGIKVKTLDLMLDSVGSGFRAALRRKDGTSWAVGDNLELRFPDATTPTSWPATLTGALATWAKTSFQVAALIALDPERVELWYTPASAIPERWRRGKVTIQA
jgi:hypothetical protein